MSPQPPRLELLHLEDRTVPSTFVSNPNPQDLPVLAIDLSTFQPVQTLDPYSDFTGGNYVGGAA